MTQKIRGLFLIVIFFLLYSGGGFSLAQTIQLVSRGVDGLPDGASFGPDLSADGRFVAFSSLAANLVAGDTNSAPDVFVFDRETGSVERVSVNSQGGQAIGAQYLIIPSISADGRFVAFESRAGNLVADDSNGVRDIFVRDRQNHTTTRVSLSSSGEEGNGDSANPVISADGRFVAFQSLATNLVPGDFNAMSPGGRAWDVFVHDRQTGQLELVSVSSQEMQGDRASTLPAISSDGRFVTFSGPSTNLAVDAGFFDDVFVRDRMLSITTLVSVSTAGVPGNANSFVSWISADGRRVSFASGANNLIMGDTNQGVDYFIHDLNTSETRRVNLNSQGLQTAPIPQGFSSRISGDGKLVVFESPAGNLVENDTNFVKDIFVHDLDSGETRRVSLAFDRKEANGPSEVPAISADGRFVAFVSSAGNLVESGNPGADSIFLVDLSPGADQPNLIFPHFVSGQLQNSAPGGSDLTAPNRTRLILLNNSSESDQGRIDFRDAAGKPIAVSVQGAPKTQLDYELDPWSSLDLETDGLGELVSGTIEVVSSRGEESQVEGLESFEVLGNFVSVSPADVLSSAQIYVSLDEFDDTGLALYNPDPEQQVTIMVTLLNGSGEVISDLEVILAPKEQLVAFVDDQELFGGIPELAGEFRGTLNLRSAEEALFTTLGLIQKRQSGALIALPVGRRSYLDE